MGGEIDVSEKNKLQGPQTLLERGGSTEKKSDALVTYL